MIFIIIQIINNPKKKKEVLSEEEQLEQSVRVVQSFICQFLL